MLELLTPITEFLNRAIAASNSCDYLAFITIIARSADAEFLQDELLRHWESFDDLTEDAILVLSPKSHTGGYGACVHHGREPAGLVNRRLVFGSRTTGQWEHAFWQAHPVNMTAKRKFYEDLGAVHSPRRPPEETEKKAAMTAAASETARYFGIRESWLPCVVVLSLSDRNALIVTADQGFSLYAMVRTALMEYEPIVATRENLKKRVSEVVDGCRRNDEEIAKARSTLDSSKQVVAHVAQSWSEQIQAAGRMLKAVSALSPESREFADFLIEWLQNDIERPADFDEKWRLWFASIADGKRGEIPEYLAVRIKKRLPGTIERKMAGYLAGTSPIVDAMKEAEREYNETATRCRGDIDRLKDEKARLLARISELKEAQPISQCFLAAAVRENYQLEGVRVEQYGALQGWTIQHFLRGRPTVKHSTAPGKYDVALSFAGDDRHVARDVANGLMGRGVTVFYDEFEKVRLWGVNLIDYLTSVYFERARFCIMFISSAYVKKMWTGLERQAMQAGALMSKIGAILPVRLDDSEVPGFLPTVGYLDYRKEGTDSIVAATVARLRM